MFSLAENMALRCDCFAQGSRVGEECGRCAAKKLVCDIRLTNSKIAH
jgi:hypothetical protein